MRTAALLQKVHRSDGRAIDAETCFALGTRTAGAVLRLPIGRIAPGYRCDLVALDLDDPSLWPVQALEKNVVYSLSPRAISNVVVDGQEVVAARRLCHVALDEIQARVRDVTADWCGQGGEHD
jgi:5-methylthioadenosine/S-adenosylhomocysteine deaminase